MSADRSRPGVASEAAPKVIAATVTNGTAETCIHGAELAADASPSWKVHILEHAIREAADAGTEFGVDDLDTPCDGNWVGGVFMRLHREGVIRPHSYRPSRKRSRAGSIITVWIGGEAS